MVCYMYVVCMRYYICIKYYTKQKSSVYTCFLDNNNNNNNIYLKSSIQTSSIDNHKHFHKQCGNKDVLTMQPRHLIE